MVHREHSPTLPDGLPEGPGPRLFLLPPPPADEPPQSATRKRVPWKSEEELFRAVQDGDILFEDVPGAPDPAEQFRLVQSLLDLYFQTEGSIALWGAEFAFVVHMIDCGKRPRKLRFLPGSFLAKL